MAEFMMRARAAPVSPRLSVPIASFLAFLAIEPVARSETLQAPFGGKAVPLGASRVACAPAPAGWSIIRDGTGVRPPEAEATVGTTGELKVAPTTAACGSSAEVVHLAVLGKRPFAEPASVNFFPDEARVEGHGRHLAGSTLVWRSTTASGSSVCKAPKLDQGTEQCSWSVGRGLGAAPGSVSLMLVPEGGHAGGDVVTFDSEGHRVEPTSLELTPARIVVARLAPADASVDLSKGRGQVVLSHPEIVTSVDCAPARCEVAAGTILVRGITSDVSSVDVKVQLVPRVFLQTSSGTEAHPTLHLAVLHCPMVVVSGPPLRSTSSARAVVHIDGGCGRDPSMLKFEVAGDSRDALGSSVGPGGADVLLAVGSTEAPSVIFTAVLAQDPSVVVASTRVETQEAPPISSSVGVPGHENLDFIPNNRPAVVHTRQPDGGAQLVVLPVEGVYRTIDSAAQTIVGEQNTAGTTTLRFGLRMESLPGALGHANLAILSDPVQRSIHPANVPAPLGAFAPPAKRLVELVCGPAASPTRIEPGATSHLPFRTRDDCRIVFHGERLARTYGTQKLKLSIDVLNPDGVSRGEGHVAETVVVRAANRPLYSWLHGVEGRFDRVVVRVSHAADEGHYLGATELVDGTPELKWSIIFGTGHVRLYATSTIPTGLYRFGGEDHSGPLSLNLGIVSRLTWLDSEGHEGFLGLEGGLVAFGLTNDESTTGESLTHVGVVTGLGIGVPVANRSSPAEASINLHGWLEHDISHDSGSGLAFVFGPSISIGNVGANL
jgi:hypothetical protein